MSETKSGDLSWIYSAKGCKARVRTDAGPTLVPLSRADKEKEFNPVTRKVYFFSK
jgi:hypothetical protein